MEKFKDTNSVRLTGVLRTRPQVGLWKQVLMTKFYLCVRNDAKNRQDRVEVTCFGTWAHFAGKVLRKGDTVKVTGRLKTLPYHKDSPMEHNTFVIAQVVIPFLLSLETINSRKNQWHRVDTLETQQACYTLIALGFVCVPKTIRCLFFFSTTLQVDVYWRYCCLKKWREMKQNNKPAARNGKGMYR